MSKPWSFLDEYRDTGIKGVWPTIPEMFKITVQRFPERKAFTSFSPEVLSLTYKESLEYVERIAMYLSGLGIRKGDTVALTGKNSPEWSIAYLSIVNIGAIVVPLDNALRKEDQSELVRRSDSTVVFTDKDKYEFLKGDLPEIKDCISLTAGFENYILDLKSDKKIAFEAVEEHDTAAILYTSGTTGVSKGVMLSHRNFSSDVWLAQANLNIYHTDVFYALLPIHHSYTMTSVFLESIYVGAEIVFGKHLVFSQILKDFKQGQVTMFLGVPMLFNKIIQGLLKGVREKGIIAYGLIRFMMFLSGFIKKTFKVNPGKKMFNFILKKAALENMRICISGGGPLAPSTFKHFNQLGIDFVQGYGLTEAAPMLTLNPVEKYKTTSVGKVIPQVEMKILNKDHDGIGDIVVKGPNIMQGYYKQDKETAEAFTEDGYLKTGDAGYLDKDNYLYLTGRKASLIVTEGGKNVYPEELEDAFQFYDEYEQVLVKGYIKDEKTLSEGIEVAFFPSEEFKKEKSNDEIKERFQNIVNEVNRTNVAYKAIERVHVLAEPMEMTTTKKIRRVEVNRNFKHLKKL
jgi:long-chain acyl-CoA synthetase